ncbi:MAG: GNAT family N-acetyltransferase [Lachnospiraceae bacterium]|nr:GNAT family N-acetyltransferase [Lachnospiraceae bacterium]
MVIKNYRNNDELRKSFNELAMKTFDINFEDWYQNGYWGEKYNPYSIVMDGKVVSNVSVNHMNFLWNGERKLFIQLGTVMTDESYRNRGLIRQIMDEIGRDYEKKTDGFFLFANDSVLDFYPKFGFQKSEEFQYCQKIFTADASVTGKRTIEQVPMRDKTAWTLLEDAMRKSIPQSSFEMVNNRELILFYVTKYMQENVYYHKEQDAYVIAEIEDGNLLIHNIFSSKPTDIGQIAKSFGNGIRQVRFGFTPHNCDGYTRELRAEEDCTLFLKGKGFENFAQDGLMFPTLSHA